MHFVELDNGTMPVGRVGEKLRMYDEWARSTEGERYLTNLGETFAQEARRVNFRLLLIVRSRGVSGDERRFADMFAQTLSLSAATRERIWLTTA